MAGFQEVFNVLRKPALFEPSTADLWDDVHISKGMLEAHLNPLSDLASRSHEFIDRSVQWMCEALDLKKGDRVLDLGCGPGLYTERFAQQGLNVTGIDYSKRSIAYAVCSAQKQGLSIEYVNRNYLEMAYEREFDLVTLIYCDFGVLEDADRDRLLASVFKALKPGGRLVFDVFTPHRMAEVTDASAWYSEEAGYWRPHPYLCLESSYRYPHHDTFMRQYTVWDETGNLAVYRTWNHTYTVESITPVLTRSGFGKISFLSDVSGRHYSEHTDTLCAVAAREG